MEGSTGSEIRFTCQPAGTIGEDQSRCGIILVRYHNLSCYHHIFVRQGYAPIRVAGSAKWHTFNLKYQDHEAAAPCEEVRSSATAMSTSPLTPSTTSSTGLPTMPRLRSGWLPRVRG